jgi:xanthine dehydrogenase YagR molybdenum-binding subunit
VVVNSTIAKRPHRRHAPGAALAVPGVLDILTHENRPQTRSLGLFYKDMTSPAARRSSRCTTMRSATAASPWRWWWRELRGGALRGVAGAGGLRREPHETNLMAHLGRAHEPSRLKAGLLAAAQAQGRCRRGLRRGAR